MMDIFEAERYFKQYNGLTFHMYREEPGKYETFKRLRLSDTTLEEWRQEILDDLFMKLKTDTDLSWVTIGTIIEVLQNTRSLKNSNGLRLLKALEDLQADEKQQILILEHFAGRVESHIDGGIYWYLHNTELKEELEESICHFISGDNKNTRYLKAIAACRQQLG